MSGVGRQQLPPGWVETTLGAVQLDIAAGVNPSQTPEDMFELYSVPSHERGAPEIIRGKDIGSNKRTIDPDTVLLCKINPRINRVWVTGNHSTHKKIASTEWIPFFPLSQIAPRYLAYFLQQDTVRDFLAGNASGVGGSLMRVRATTIRDFRIQLAPTVEQSRIADAIDELFSDLDTGVALLERVREKLKLYRAAILNAAIEGEITAIWRAHHPRPESATELLKRILAERRRLSEEDQLAKLEGKGQQRSKDWKAKYTEPRNPNTINTELPSLPVGWCWATLDQVLWKLRSGTAATSGRQVTSYPVLKSSAVRPGAVDLDDVNYLQESQSTGLENYLQIGDVLITRLSGSVDFVGCCAVVAGLPSRKMQYPDRIFCGKLVPGIKGTFLTYCFRHRRIRASLGSAAKSTAGHQRISLSDLYSLMFALPPIAEQEAIIEAVEDQLSVIEHLEGDLDAELKNAQALRQSILRHAFNGRLVPQDPNDEPASELLRRIATEREAHARDAAAAKHGAKRTSGNRTSRRGRRSERAKMDA